jgi:hypothetical protein
MPIVEPNQKTVILRKVAYQTPVLANLGRIQDVTQKSGGAEDGGAAMMDKTGQG